MLETKRREHNVFRKAFGLTLVEPSEDYLHMKISIKTRYNGGNVPMNIQALDSNELCLSVISLMICVGNRSVQS